MKENKLGILLTSFKNEDWKAFSKFAKSRYSSDSDSAHIIAYIKKHKSRYDPKRMDGEYLRKKVRPSAKPIVFANAVSQLCKHIEAYLIHAEVQADPMMKDTLLLQAFANRGITDQFLKQKKKAKANRENQPLGLWSNYHDFMGEYLTYYRNMTKGVAESKRVLDNAQQYLKAFEKVLDGYLGVEMHNRTVLIKEDWEGRFKRIKLQIDEDDELEIIYYNLKNLKEFKNADSYEVLKE